MNIEQLETIASWLEGGAKPSHGIDEFNMGFCKDRIGCKTYACIAGAAESMFGSCNMGLTSQQQDALFFPPGWSYEQFFSARYTPAWAARCIRHLIATGEVDWAGTKNEASAIRRTA